MFPQSNSDHKNNPKWLNSKKKKNHSNYKKFFCCSLASGVWLANGTCVWWRCCCLSCHFCGQCHWCWLIGINHCVYLHVLICNFNSGPRFWHLYCVLLRQPMIREYLRDSLWVWVLCGPLAVSWLTGGRKRMERGTLVMVNIICNRMRGGWNTVQHPCDHEFPQMYNLSYTVETKRILAFL